MLQLNGWEYTYGGLSLTAAALAERVGERGGGGVHRGEVGVLQVRAVLGHVAARRRHREHAAHAEAAKSLQSQ